MSSRRVVLSRIAGGVLLTVALTWGSAHLFYMHRFRSAQLQIITASNAPLRPRSTSVIRTEQVMDPSGSRTYWRMDVSFDRHGRTAFERSARADIDITGDSRYGGPIDLRGRRILLSYRTSQTLQGRGRHLNRMQIELYDTRNRVMRGPFQAIVLTDQMLPLDFRPYTDIPIPLGHMDDDFDLAHVQRIGIRLRVDQFADRYAPSFYPATGSITLSPIVIAPNDTPQGGVRDVFHRRSFPRLSPLPERTEPFAVGINYPWRNYGWDFGRNPWASDPNVSDGLAQHHKELERDFANLHEHGIDIIRVFVFCDLRTGLAYGPDKKLTGFDQFVADDMRTLLEAARATGVRLILTLFNFDMVDGLEFNGSGEHQEFILDRNARQELLSRALEPLFKDMAPYEDVIYAIDPMNEPEHAQFLTNHENFGKLSEFLSDVAVLSRRNLPQTPISLGSANRNLLGRFWSDFPNDIPQFHFYQQMEDEEGVLYDTPSAYVTRTGPVIIGEVEGDRPAMRLTVAKRNGYAAALLWSYRADDGYTVDLNEVRRWKEEQK